MMLIDKNNFEDFIIWIFQVFFFTYKFNNITGIKPGRITLKN